MAKAMVRVFVGCGSGIATSNMAKAKVDAILDKAGIPHQIKTGNVGEMRLNAANYDVFLVTTAAPSGFNMPVIPVFGLLSGMGAAQAEAQIIQACKDALAQ